MQRVGSRRRRATAVAGALLGIAPLTAGCSLLFHADADQCASTHDCTMRGGAFSTSTCVLGTCVTSAISVGDSGADGALDATTDGAGADADGGTPEAGCHSNADCVVADSGHPEVACDVASGRCLQLTTDECPFVINDYTGQIAQPIYVGAFATLPPDLPKSHPSYQNYSLAMSEFATQGGIPGYDPVHKQVGLRMPVAIVCNVAADVDTVMNHLVFDVGTPAVVSSLDSLSLATMFLNDARPNNVFVVNAFGANSSLTSIAGGTQGLLWHMLGQSIDDAPAYQAYFPSVEAYVRTQQNLGTAPMRVATITATATDTQDLQRAVLSVLQFNGTPAMSSANSANYMDISIDSVLNANTSYTSIDVSGAVQSLLSFRPNVVISFASSEFVKTLQVYEQQLPSTSNPIYPFYLVGPYNMDSTVLQTWIGTGTGPTSEGKRTRVAGVGVASAANNPVLTQYDSRFLAAGYPPGSLGSENYYDAMYFAIDSLVGAGPLPTITGTNAAQGMLRLLSGVPYDMGPADMGNIFGALGSPNGTISLDGTLGPPDFTIRTGARVGAGSVYCLQRSSDGSTSYDYDVETVVPSPDGGAPTLTGTFPCYTGM